MMRLNLKLQPFFVLSIFVVFSATLLSPCHANDDLFEEEPNLFKDIRGLTKGEATLSWRIAADDENASPANNSTLKLAAERTRRIDPRDDFKYYEGGWDVTNEHYYLSLLFSGAPLWAIGAIWCFVVALFFIIIILCCCCCRNKRRISYSRITYALSLIFLVIFLNTAIAGSVLVYTGEGNFRNATKEVMGFIVRKAIAVVDLLNDVLSNLNAATKLAVGKFTLPDDFKQNIKNFEDLSHKIADNPKDQAEKVTKTVYKYMDSIGKSLVTLTAIVISLAFLGFIISICGWQIIVYFLLFLGWILVTGLFILCGITLVLRNGVGDTCVAMEDWLQHPQNLTVLSKILPCMDKETAQRTLDFTKNVSFQMANLANAFITDVANSDSLPPVQELSYNNSGPYLPLVCNPYYPNMTERKCDPHEVSLNSAPQAYQPFVCNTSSSGVCSSTGRLTPTYYDQITAFTKMSDTMNRYGPVLVDLADCTFVVETFRQISKEHCPKFRRYSNYLFVGLTLASVALMFSVSLWLVFVRERRLQISS